MPHPIPAAARAARSVPPMLDAILRRLSRTGHRWRSSFMKRAVLAPVLRSIPRDAVILEIGGGYSPRFRKANHPNVHHLDHCSAEELRAKYATDPAVGHLVGNIQHVDYVHASGPMRDAIPAGLRFDVIYGSHTLEHQVDLIGHLQSIEELLAPGGRVIEMIPDLRACNDALRFPTVTSDALLVHRRAPSIHQGKQAFDGRARVIDRNQGHPMIDADFDGVGFAVGLREAHAAMLAAELPGTPYFDLHAWTFTPESFRLLMIELRLLGLTRLEPTVVTAAFGNQFCAVLEHSAEPADALPPGVVARLERERLTLSRGLRL